MARTNSDGEPKARRRYGLDEAGLYGLLGGYGRLAAEGSSRSWRESLGSTAVLVQEAEEFVGVRAQNIGKASAIQAYLESLGLEPVDVQAGLRNVANRVADRALALQILELARHMRVHGVSSHGTRPPRARHKAPTRPRSS